jgi:hypothetical protein
MGLALLAGTFGAGHGQPPSAADPVRQVPALAVAVQAAPADAHTAEVASGAAPVRTRQTATSVVAAPQAPAVPDRTGFPPAVDLADQAARAGSPGAALPAAGSPAGVPLAPARGAVGQRAPPRSA